MPWRPVTEFNIQEFNLLHVGWEGSRNFHAVDSHVNENNKNKKKKSQNSEIEHSEKTFLRCDALQNILVVSSFELGFQENEQIKRGRPQDGWRTSALWLYPYWDRDVELNIHLSNSQHSVWLPSHSPVSAFSSKSA